MKKILIVLAAVAVSASAFAQGTISYYNRNIVDAGVTHQAPILLPSGLGPGTTGANTYSIGLFLKSGSTYTLLATAQDGTSAVSGFRTAAGLEAFMPGPITIAVNGVGAGSSATFQVRAWETAAGSYATASTTPGRSYGQSADLVISQLGGGTPGGAVPTPNLNGLNFNGFTMTMVPVPEPSTFALGIAGLGALAMMRRRKK